MPVRAKDSFQQQMSVACTAHARLGPASLVLYNASTLYFETDAGDGFPRAGILQGTRAGTANHHRAAHRPVRIPLMVSRARAARPRPRRWYCANGPPEPFTETARRKIVPDALERRVLAVFPDSASLFRKTSSAVSYVHDLPDYNGHVGIRKRCDIYPDARLYQCRQAHRTPTAETDSTPSCPRRAGDGPAIRAPGDSR